MDTLFTIGHSRHPIERFVGLLRDAGIELVADVRRYPGSRRNPQFGATALAESLARAAIGYEAFGEPLGGRRAASAVAGTGPPDNSAWRNASFRAYADHMSTPEFTSGIETLIELARERRTAIMCAEAHPSRCHRQLISDALVARGWRVAHLLADGTVQDHQLNPHALLEDGRLSYPAQPSLGL